MRKNSIAGSTVGLIVVLIILALAGCGRKGGLYLPENVKADKEKTESTQAPDEDER